MTPQSALDTIGDLARVLRAEADATLSIDGRRVDRDVLLSEAGCVHGSHLDIAAPAPARDSAPARGVASDSDSASLRAVAEASIVTGPDCTGTLQLAAGRHVIGRSHAAHIRITDPQLGLHHAVVDVREDAVTVTQLSGQAPIRLDGEPVTGTRTANLPSRLSIGMNDLLITAPAHVMRPEDRATAAGAGSVVAASNDPWRRIVQRGPDRPIEPTGDPITPPAPVEVQRTPPATALIGAAVAVLGAGAIAVVLGQMMFALFAAFGAVASAVTWLTGAISTWRRNRRARRAVGADRRRFLDDLTAARIAAREHHLAVHAEVGQTVATADALAGPVPLRSGVWTRRLAEGEAGRSGQSFGAARDDRVTFHPVIGTGTSRWTPPFDGELAPDSVTDVDCAATIDDVPIPLALACGEVLAISGGLTVRDALLRSIVCQMAVRHGPADWQLVIVSADHQKWSWAGWLPHSHTATGTVLIADPVDPGRLATVLALAAGPTPRPTLLVVDDPALFAVRTSGLRRFVERAQPATLTTIGVGAPTPAVCNAVIEVGSTGAVMINRLDGSIGGVADTASSISMCGLSMECAARIARSMANLVDPETLARSEARLGRAVALSDLDDVVLAAGGDDAGRRAAVSAVCRRWRDGGADPSPIVALGESADGVVEIDLVADGPHALVAGTTGSGKSELLRSLVIGLALRVSPEHLTFVLVDYKGGSTFDRCAELPHVVGIVTDLDAGLAARALTSLEAELHRRERMLRDVGAADLTDYRRNPASLVLPRLAVVIDEFAALAKELPDFLAALVGIAQRGRSLGVHLILATQRPAGVVSDDIRANTNLRVALRLNDTADASDVVGDALPASFARDVPGRAALRLGPDELVVFQAARCSGQARGAATSVRVEPPSMGRSSSPIEPGAASDGRTELDVAVAVVSAAFTRLATDPPHRPWIDALPDQLSSATVDVLADTTEHDGVGVIDDPTAQCRRILQWQRELGNLALVGSLGSGTTSALRAVVAARCRHRSPGLEHWYVIDARGAAALDELTWLDHVGAVVRVQEQERVHRVIARLVDEIDRRSGAPLPERTVSLAIDGLGSLRAALATVEHASTLTLLERLLADGPPVGVSVCWTDDPASAMRSGTAAETWVFRCDDPGVARSFGVPALGSPPPGHLRIASCGREAVVAVDAGLLPPNDTWHEVVGGGSPAAPPPPITVLPAQVSAAMLPLPPRCRGVEQFLDIEVGLRYDDLGVAALRVPFGDHVFIGGAASVGKTSALRHIARAWQAAHPDGRIVDVERRRPLGAESTTFDGTQPWLITVDDAERVDDTDGALAALVAAPPPGVLIVAAGRLDAVRSAYGHWAREVARSRCGLILTSAGDVDGDLLGATLPRRLPLPARPGLAWLIDGAGHRLVQLVDPGPDPE